MSIREYYCLFCGDEVELINKPPPLCAKCGKPMVVKVSPPARTPNQWK